jgi:surface protein
VVFGYEKDHPETLLQNNGIQVQTAQGANAYAYYEKDDDGLYTVYILSSDPVYAPADSTGLFENMSALTTVVTDNFDMSRATTMANMFKDCTALTELDTTGWNTANVTDMSGVFYQCGALTRIRGLEDWNTGAATNMQTMFYHTGLTGDLDLHNWDVSDVTDMSQMFNECYNITNINAAGWDTASVTNMRSMFRECLKAQTINVTGWNTANVIDTYTMFIRCRAMTDLIGSGDLDFSNVVQMNSMCEGWDSVVYIDVTNWNCGSCVDMSQMFAWALSLETIEGIRNWDVSNVTTMSAMFYDSDSLKKLDLSGWDTSSVQQMDNMFRFCDALKEVNLAGWDTSSVVYSRLMFFDAKGLERIYVSDSWDMSNVTRGDKTFGNNTKLVGGNGTKYSDQKIGVAYARIDTPAVTDAEGNVITPAVPGYLTHINDKPVTE